MDTVMVTGAAGFIGSHLCDRLLAEGKRVVAVDDLSTGKIANLTEARGYEGQQFTFYNMDIRLEGLRTIVERHRPEVVMHLAAQASVSASVENPMLDASVNVLGLLNLLETAAACDVRKIVFAASGGTLYGEPRTLPVKETAIRGAQPVSPYGISKAVALDYLRFYRQNRGVDFTALALANIYGPRQDPFGEAGVVAIFGSKMLAGEAPTIFGDGNQTRDYLFVDDTVHAFALASERGSGGLYNIGTGLETSVNRVFQLLAQEIGFRRKPTFGPPREGDLLRSALDWKLAEKELGWKPWTTLEDGFRQTVEALRSA
ncbi:MAG TPA: SDR family NAD(P)-dependent oxidoreductase [Actinomycetota bacterium]|nr:SDR family NAD(P)-dependent oxidoreductase [Actinomycetota bacterium]